MKIKGGEKVEAELKKIQKAVKKSKQLKVGFFADATYPDGEHVAQVAFWNEYGTKNIPPRPFFRTTINKFKDSWGNDVLSYLQTKGHKNDFDYAFNRLGAIISMQIRMTIFGWTTPPNAPCTIKHKGFNQPLIETHNMEKSITWKLGDK